MRIHPQLRQNDRCLAARIVTQHTPVKTKQEGEVERVEWYNQAPMRRFRTLPFFKHSLTPFQGSGNWYHGDPIRQVERLILPESQRHHVSRRGSAALGVSPIPQHSHHCNRAPDHSCVRRPGNCHD
jgi:hypothetical protein